MSNYLKYVLRNYFLYLLTKSWLLLDLHSPQHKCNYTLFYLSFLLKKLMPSVPHGSWIPVWFAIYQADSICRKRLKKDNLITFVSICLKIAEIDTLNSIRKLSVALYPIQYFTDLYINQQGNIKIKNKKRFWWNLKRIGI